MEFVWADEDATYIVSRSDRYPGALDIEAQWTQEVLSDGRLLEVTPYPRSRVGASGFIGWSSSAQRVLVVIAYRDADGDLHGMNAWPATGRDLARTWRVTMAKKLDEKTSRAARADARALEKRAGSKQPYPAKTNITRPNQPSRMFNVRLSHDQFHALQELAQHRHLPVSTMARAWLLDRLEQERRAG